VESLGDKLKSARESKGYSFDYIGRETNIARRYLEALEMEDFSKFPGEPYVLGFLRNYGEYLGLDVQELLSLYRALKIQEQPVPVEQLLKAPSRAPRVLFIIALILVILCALGGGVYFFLNHPWQSPSVAVAARSEVEYTLEANNLERRFYRGDSILVPLGDDRYKLELTNLGEAVTIAAPGGAVILDLSQEALVDVNSDDIGDLRITVADFVRNEPATGALLRFELSNEPAFPGGELLPADSAESGDAGESIPSQEAAGAAAANTPVIFSSPSAYPFTLQAAFQGYCMFRWEILGERDRRDRNEQYFVRTDELNIQAQNGIRIWVSNAAAVRLQVIGGGRTVPLEIGGAGEVVVADLRWVRDEDGRFRLVLIRLD
jgi:cytoskeletal protein RodZ